MPQSTSPHPFEGTDYKKKARGLFLWLLLCVASMVIISSFLISYLADLHGQSKTGVQQCVEQCGTAGIRLYDKSRSICECSEKEK